MTSDGPMIHRSGPEVGAIRRQRLAERLGLDPEGGFPGWGTTFLLLTDRQLVLRTRSAARNRPRTCSMRRRSTVSGFTGSTTMPKVGIGSAIPAMRWAAEVSASPGRAVSGWLRAVRPESCRVGICLVVDRLWVTERSSTA